MKSSENLQENTGVGLGSSQKQQSEPNHRTKPWDPLLMPLGTNTAAEAVSTTAAEWWGLEPAGAWQSCHPCPSFTWLEAWRSLLLHTLASNSKLGQIHLIGKALGMCLYSSCKGAWESTYYFQILWWDGVSASLGGRVCKHKEGVLIQCVLSDP